MTFYHLWLVLAGLVGLLWIARWVAVELAIRNRCLLHVGSHAGPPEPPLRLSIVLAAKDEESNIEACVQSLLEQDYPSYELIVVDDRSTDRTGAILERLALEYAGRVQMLRVEHLPAGWFGKHNAVRMGVERASGEWLLFTDADCRQTSSRTLSLAMSEALQARADFLSVLPNLERQQLWEKILQPVCAAILMVWFRPSRVNNPRSPAAYANGAFMLMSRACYEGVGGHEAVRDKINEDIHMAAIAKQKGFRLRVVENRGLYVTRMYDTPAAAFHGWSRIFYGCLVRPGRIFAALSLVFVAGVIPWVSFFGALTAWLTQDELFWSRAAVAWGAVILTLQVVTARLYQAVGYGLVWSLTYMLGATVGMAILFNALLKSLGLTRTTWRRTRYAKSRLAQDSASSI